MLHVLRGFEPSVQIMRVKFHHDYPQDSLQIFSNIPLNFFLPPPFFHAPARYPLNARLWTPRKRRAAEHENKKSRNESGIFMHRCCVWLASRVAIIFIFFVSREAKHSRKPINQSQKACSSAYSFRLRWLCFRIIFCFIVKYKISVWAQLKVCHYSSSSFLMDPVFVFFAFIVSTIFTWEPQKADIRIYVQFINLQSIIYSFALFMTL